MSVQCPFPFVKWKRAELRDQDALAAAKYSWSGCSFRGEHHLGNWLNSSSWDANADGQAGSWATLLHGCLFWCINSEDGELACIKWHRNDTMSGCRLFGVTRRISLSTDSIRWVLLPLCCHLAGSGYAFGKCRSSRMWLRLERWIGIVYNHKWYMHNHNVRT